ncbi:MAG: MogA/MoaB family molybdenum cofactor biosynthesis protein [Acidobacteriota bacterium]
MLKIAVITVSDRAHKGEYEDLSGPKIKKIIEQSGMEAEVSLTVVPDEREHLLEALFNNLNKDIILTTGGTGLGPRDITPDVCGEIFDKELPGISEFLRRESYKETPNALLSRGRSGVKGKTLIVNFPGSVKAVSLCTHLIIPVLEHARKMLHGEGH